MPVEWIPGTGYFSNSYVYGSVLIDTGATPTAVEPYRDDIGTIVLTHCHYDHIAHLREIRDMCGNPEICIHELDAPGITEPSRSLSTMFGERGPDIGPDVILSEGDEIGGLKVIHTPGHTPGGICLYDAEEMVLFSGDTVFADGAFGRFDFPGGSLEQLSNSVKKLSELDVEGLCPGHGTPAFSNGRRHILAALRALNTGYF
ncbi:beta-lactamase domain-containing protein [Methanolacinia petrolearia DSM 11571]|uniref:Beta-lactamase domain-containing protein n=1 Tax=Methanolacinia petrolearia (strain DSM 11571 / OCM 486 / SEBR 4847) TaxID=679926 RepID=E1RFU6_METP4|nr:MBL fold metallo-hydrolase [Methanolacinia petrolearia]ADN35098.1 beta-lactamase domain-containing protein [Methanolacinia petrolearia DSM 11571]